jgi:hypothetical protein
MSPPIAEQLLPRYIDGWKQRNRPMVERSAGRQALGIPARADTHRTFSTRSFPPPSVSPATTFVNRSHGAAQRDARSQPHPSPDADATQLACLTRRGREMAIL